MRKTDCIKILSKWRINVKKRITFLNRASKIFSILNYSLKVGGILCNTILLSLDSVLLSKVINTSDIIILPLTICILTLQGINFFTIGIDTLFNFSSKSKSCSISLKHYKQIIDEMLITIEDLKSQEDDDFERYSYITLLYQNKLQSILENQPKLYLKNNDISISDDEILSNDEFEV